MAQLLVRDLPDETKERLRVRAAEHRRSMAAEARGILIAAVAEPDPVLSWLEAGKRFREQWGGVDIPEAERQEPRPVDPLT